MEKEFKANFVRSLQYSLKYGFYISMYGIIVFVVFDMLLKIEDLNISIYTLAGVPFLIAYIICFIYCITSKIKITNDEIIFSNVFKNNRYTFNNNYFSVLAEKSTLNGIGFANRTITIYNNNIKAKEYCNYLNKQSFEDLSAIITRIKAEIKSPSKNEKRELYYAQGEYIISDVYKKRLKENKNIITKVIIAFLLIIVVFPLFNLNKIIVPKIAIVISDVAFVLVFGLVWKFNINRLNKLIKAMPFKVITYDRGIKIDNIYYSYDSIDTIIMQSPSSRTGNPYFKFSIKTDNNTDTYILGYDNRNIYFEIYSIIKSMIPNKFKNELL